MKRSAAISAVLAVLLLGVLIGILGTHLFYARKLEEPGSPAMMAGRFFAARLDRELSLSADQRAGIDAILDQTQREAMMLREEMRPRVGALTQEAADRISALLTAEQRERFEELRRRHRGRAEHFFLGPPGPPGRRGPWRHRWHHRGPPHPEEPDTSDPSP